VTDIAAARRALFARVLDGAGKAPSTQRRAAFENAGSSGPVRTLLGKIAGEAHRVGDDDVRNALSAGLTEDQVFELAVCSALGQANRQYEAALAALALAIGKE
jgi:hypothetical protein